MSVRRAAPLLVVAVAAAACGPPPRPPRPGPVVQQPLAVKPRLVVDTHVGRAVIAPEFLREVAPPAGSWLRLQYRDPANPTGAIVDFPVQCPEVDARAVPCGGGRACVMLWRQGEELLAGRAALSLGEHVYWWPGPVATCAVVGYSLGPGPFADALQKFVLDFADFVRPVTRRAPASAPAAAPPPERP